MSAVTIKGKIYRTGCNPVDDVKKLKAIPNLKDLGLPTVTREDAINYCQTKKFFARNVFDDSWIGNQGSYGSCNGYAGAKALQRARVRRRLKFVALSGEGLYGQINGNHDNGSMLIDGMNAIGVAGVPAESIIPPRTRIYTSQFPQGWKQNASRFVADECYQIEDEWSLVTALVLGFDCVVAVNVGDNWMHADSNNVIPNSPGPGNHAIGVDDIRFFGNQFQFEHYGSWGTSIHDHGRAFITWDRQLNYTQKYHGFYAIRSTKDDPEDVDNPTPLKV